MSASTQATGLIRIIKAPGGPNPPRRIRRAWIGCELPCHPVLGYSDSGHRRDVVTDAQLPNRQGFSVPQREALLILARKDPEAAQWWYSRGYPQDDDFSCFDFEEGCAEIISGVTRQRLVHVEDDMQGDPDR